jgi:hypothetical protein
MLRMSTSPFQGYGIHTSITAREIVEASVRVPSPALREKVLFALAKGG